MCSAELAFKTDPQNSDYTVESGATRNFEPRRAEDEELDREKKKRDAEEMGYAMKSLENRTLGSKREMDILAALDEIKPMKSRHATVSLEAMLEALQRKAEEKFEEEDGDLIKSIFQRRQKKVIIRRISHEDEEFDMSNVKLKKRKVADEVVSSKPTDSLTKAGSTGSGTDQNDGKSMFKSRISVIKKPVAASDSNRAGENKKVEESTSSGLLSLCQNYDHSDDEDDY